MLFHEREIWWTSLGLNIGAEQDGKHELFERPVLIIRKFNREVLWVVPLTRSQKNSRYYFPIQYGSTQNSVVILSQLRLISSKRLLRKIDTLSIVQFESVVRSLGKLIKKIGHLT